IRDPLVTGVQTCALPISSRCASFGSLGSGETTGCNQFPFLACESCGRKVFSQCANSSCGNTRRMASASARHGERKSSPEGSYPRSEERRVGKEREVGWTR